MTLPIAAGLAPAQQPMATDQETIAPEPVVPGFVPY